MRKRWLSLALGVAVSVSAGAAAPFAAPRQHGPSGGGQGYLGIEFKDLPDAQAAQMHCHGVEIWMVDHDGPAGKAGLRPHDVVVAVNGQLVDSALSLRRLIHEAGAGVQMAIQVVRLGKPVTLTAKLASRDEVDRAAMASLAAGDEFEPPQPQPSAPMYASSFADRAPADSVVSGASASSKASVLKEMLHATPFTGVAMEPMEPQLAGFFGAPAGTGLLVNTVLPGSPAETAGLHAGDIVLRADAITLKSTTDWTHHLRGCKGRPLQLTILRDKHEQSVTLVPDAKRKTQVEWPEIPGMDGALRS